MMKSLPLTLTLATTLLTVSTAALAGPFGGFTSGGSVVSGTDRVCEPLASTNPVGTPKCEKISAAALAKRSVAKPKRELGKSARYSAKTSGTVLTIFAAGDSKSVVRWDSVSPLGGATKVFVNKAGSIVAIEYQTRFGGRMVPDVVAFRVAPAASTPGVSGAAKPATPTKPATPVSGLAKLSDAEQATYDKALRSAWKQLQRKKYARATAAADKALAVWDQSAQALAIIAAAKARQKDNDGALSALERLADSRDPEAPEYRVDARTATAFAKLRADARFRLAVGITPNPKRPPTAYERVMGFGGKWEQRLIACEQPEVKLALKRTRKRFSLRIKSKCGGGGAETTHLSGSWTTKGTGELDMSFPNHGSDDEGMSCQIERCRDSSGEDCVRCKIDQDLEFLLRVIRR